MITQVVIHTNLAQMFCHSSLLGPHQWAYIAWAWTRSQNQTWFYRKELAYKLSELSGRHVSTTYRWLKVGLEKGLFIEGQRHGRDTLSLVGKERTFIMNLNGQNPGKAVLIDADKLFSSTLRELRAWLMYTFAAENPKVRSHINMAACIGRVKQTSKNYAKAIHYPKRFGYHIAKLKGKPAFVTQQSPNTWLTSRYYKTYTKAARNMHSKYITTQERLKHTKLYFENLYLAKKASIQRVKAGMFNVITYYYDNTTIPNSKYNYFRSYNADILSQS